MNSLPRSLFIACLLGSALTPCLATAQSSMDQTVDLATNVLDEIMSVPAHQIPEYLLADAQGVAIIPNVVKGGFVVGVRHGRGVALVRDAAGRWNPPIFVSLTGGSIGWQAGIQATDVVLVFRTRKSIDGLMTGKLTIGVDAAAA
ncbi:MAG TPA: lipid-binding SYLF domain-containing protein, partial [Pirellulaceae bacterium]|nr:lipid-binding SYLF domain-containing protein [Pirellulaceae bacterium]